MKTSLFFCSMSIAGSVVAQKQYTFVFLNKKLDAEQISDEQRKKVMDGHMTNMGRLAKEGKLLAAGPFEGGGGLFIFNTKDVKEAQEWLSTDPGVQAKRWNVEVLPYFPRRGSVCAVGEKFTMVSYNFIRFVPMVTKTTATDYPELIREHDDYVRKIIEPDSVVTEATFGEQNGGIIIFRGEMNKDVLDKDPGVQQGLPITDNKKLYIAKGSFCEK